MTAFPHPSLINGVKTHERGFGVFLLGISAVILLVIYDMNKMGNSKQTALSVEFAQLIRLRKIKFIM